MPLSIISKPLSPGGFFEDVFPKSTSFWHFTAAPTAYSAWMQFQTTPARLHYPISVPYIIEGPAPYLIGGKPALEVGQAFSVIECFDPRKWSYHVGLSGAYAMNHKQDKRSVPVEVACIGPLVLGHDQDTLLWGPLDGSGMPTYTYGKLSDPKCPPVQKLAKPFRNREYFVPMPKEQTDAMVQLAVKIHEDFNIPKIIAPLEKRFVCDPAYFNDFKGVVTHANYIDGWKWDHSPQHSDAFWCGLIENGFKEAQS